MVPGRWRPADGARRHCDENLKREMWFRAASGFHHAQLLLVNHTVSVTRDKRSDMQPGSVNMNTALWLTSRALRITEINHEGITKV